MRATVFHIEELYRQCIESTAGYRLNWPPDPVINPGIFGTVHDNIFTKKGEIQGLTLRQYQPKVKAPGISLAIELNSSAGDAQEMSLIFKDLSHTCIDDFSALEQNLVAKADRKAWSADHRVIGEIIHATALELEVAEKSKYLQWVETEPWLQGKLHWKKSNKPNGNFRTATIKGHFIVFYQCWQLIKNYKKSDKERNWDFAFDNPDNWSLCSDTLL